MVEDSGEKADSAQGERGRLMGRAAPGGEDAYSLPQTEPLDECGKSSDAGWFHGDERGKIETESVRTKRV